MSGAEFDESAYSYLRFIESTLPISYRMWRAATEDEFVKAAEEAIESAVRKVEGGVVHYHALGEVGLSQLLCQLLETAQIDGSSEENHNGHVDVTIRHPCSRPFSMLGECKIYDGYGRHRDGCNQLLNRYMSGRAKRGFCMDFCKKKQMYIKFEEVRDEFGANKPLGQVGPVQNHWIRGAFVTEHKHFTGALVEVLHLACNMYHPEVSADEELPVAPVAPGPSIAHASPAGIADKTTPAPAK